MQKYLYLYVLLWMIISTAHTQETFSRRYDFGYSAVVFNGLAVRGDSIFVSGILGDSIFPYRTGSFLAILDSSGELLHLNAKVEEQSTFELWGNALEDTGDGFVAVGYAVDTNWNGLVVKYADSGETLWEKKYDSFLGHQEFFRLSDVLIDGEKIYVSGVDINNISSSYQSSGILGILSEEGELLSYHTYGNSSWTNHIHSLAKRSENEYVLSGSRNKYHIQNQDFDAQCQIYGVDSSGQQLWEWRSPSTELYKHNNSAVPTPDGGLIVASALGTIIWVNAENDEIVWECIIFKLNSEHEQEWVRPFRMGVRTEDTEFQKVIACPDGSGYLAAGLQGVQLIEGGNINVENAWDIGGYLGKVSPQGDSLWDRLILHPNLPTFSEFHNIHDLKPAPDGGYLLIGESRSPGTEPSQQGWLVKVDEWGCLVPGCHLPSSTNEPSQSLQLSLQLYPNPATEAVNIFLKDEHIARRRQAELRLVDMQGKVLRRHAAGKLDEVTNMLPLYGLAAGPYLLQYVADGEVLCSEQLIINK